MTREPLTGVRGWEAEIAQREGAQWWVGQGFRPDTQAALPLVTAGGETREDCEANLIDLARQWDGLNGPAPE